MEKCFLKELKSEVNNPSLEKIGEICIPILSGSTIGFITNATFKNSSYNVVDIVSGSATITENSISKSFPYEFTVTSTKNILVTASTDCVISLRSKYNICKISSINDWDINTQAFEYSPITECTLSEPTKMHGDLKYIIKKGNIQASLSFGNDNGLFAGSDLSIFGDCLSATSINIRYCNSISGSIEKLVARWVGNGRTTGSCAITCNGTTVKFANNYVSAGNNKSLSWEPNATAGRTSITFNGVTEVIDSSTGEIVA